MTKNNKIIIAGAAIFPGGAGGAVRCMHMLAKGFAENGHAVEAVTTYGSDTQNLRSQLDGFMVRSFTYVNRETFKIGLNVKIKAHILFFLYLFYATVKRKHDLFLFYGPVPSFVIIGFFARLVNQNVAYFMSDIQSKNSNHILAILKRYLFNAVDIFLANLSNHIIVLGTSKLLNHYTRLAPGTPKTQILPPIDAEMFSRGNGIRFKQRYGLGQNNIITYSGTLDGIEGINILLAAMAVVAKQIPHYTLVLAGQPSPIDYVIGEKVDYEKMAEQIGVRENTIFTGHLRMSDVIDLLAASDLLVMPKIDHPANQVASPIKIAEYLAAGRPIISSRVCELDQHLNHMEHVVFCEPGNVLDLADKICLVLNNKDLKETLSKNARLISMMFDFKVITDKICNQVL